MNKKEKFDDDVKNYEINKSNTMNNEIKIPKNFEFTKFSDKQIFHNHLTDRKVVENIIHKSEEIIKFIFFTFSIPSFSIEIFTFKF